MCTFSCFDFFPQLKRIEQPGEWEREGKEKEEAFHPNKRGRKNNNNDDSEFSFDNNLSNVLATTLLQPAIT